MIEIKKRISPNKYVNRNNYKPEKIIIVNHITEGSYQSCINWFLNPKSEVSAHFVVSKQGDITQMIELTDGSWANATNRNINSGLYYGLSENDYIRSKDINANLFTVSIEHEGIYKNSKGALTEAQYQSTLELHKYIIAEIKKLYNIDIPLERTHIIGHCDVTPKIKPNCPGQNFPFDRLINDLQNHFAIENGWKSEGLKYLSSTNLIDYNAWIDKLDEPMPVWAITTILARIARKM